LDFTLDILSLKASTLKVAYICVNSLIALWIALSLYTAAFIAENVRAGIQAVAKGSIRSCICTWYFSWSNYELNHSTTSFKNYNTTCNFAVLELNKKFVTGDCSWIYGPNRNINGYNSNQTGRELETVLMGMAIYLIISLAISTVMNWYNNSVKLVER
jgi:general L-amino acid transport system permease protein